MPRGRLLIVEMVVAAKTCRQVKWTENVSTMEYATNTPDVLPWGGNLHLGFFTHGRGRACPSRYSGRTFLTHRSRTGLVGKRKDESGKGRRRGLLCDR